MKALMWKIGLSLVVSINVQASINYRDKAFERRVSLLVNAKSKLEITQINKKMAEYDDVKSECTRQLTSQHLPTQCFRQLDIEERLKLIEVHRLESAKKVLARICELRVDLITDVRELRLAIRELRPGLECMKKAKIRVQQQEYKDVEGAPLELFESVRRG